MNFRKFGYEFFSDDKKECFENIFLIYDGLDLFWITCSNKYFNNIEKYFINSEVIIMGFSLYKKENYKMKFLSNIKYKHIFEDLKDNHLENKIKINFSHDFYKKYNIFGIDAENYEVAIDKLKNHLMEFEVILY